jgi:pimeloyl-ACP methyl ester carboxylesterase
MSAAAAGKEKVIGLVYVAGFAPAVGESTAELTGRYPGSTLAETLVRTSLPGGGVDLYIEQNAFTEQFCHDVPADVAALMAATQRPMTEAALTDRVATAAWMDVPSYFVIPTADRSIPADAQRFMAERAGSRKTIEIEDASHAVGDSQPDVVAQLILEAAEALTPTQRRQLGGSSGLACSRSLEY